MRPQIYNDRLYHILYENMDNALARSKEHLEQHVEGASGHGPRRSVGGASRFAKRGIPRWGIPSGAAKATPCDKFLLKNVIQH